MKRAMKNKSLSWMVFSVFILFGFVYCSLAGAQEWQAADGGMSADSMSGGLYAFSGTGDPIPELTANLNLIVGTGGGFITPDQDIIPLISMDATDFVDVYTVAVVGNLVVYFDICNFFDMVDAPTPCFTDYLDKEMFDISASDLLEFFPGVTYVPFGIFIRVVEAGTGLDGNILAEKGVTSYIADLPPLPAPAQSPW